MAAAAFEPALGRVTEELRRCTIQVLDGTEMGLGSGVVLSRGMAVTNAHVVRDVTEARVRLWSGKIVEASIRRVDRGRDLARDQRTELVEHGRNGRIRDSDSYGRDPNPPRDRKH